MSANYTRVPARHLSPFPFLTPVPPSRPFPLLLHFFICISSSPFCLLSLPSFSTVFHIINLLERMQQRWWQCKELYVAEVMLVHAVTIYNERCCESKFKNDRKPFIISLIWLQFMYVVQKRFEILYFFWGYRWSSKMRDGSSEAGRKNAAMVRGSTAHRGHVYCLKRSRGAG